MVPIAVRGDCQFQTYAPFKKFLDKCKPLNFIKTIAFITIFKWL